jgi:hypothetical protein
MTIFTVKEHEIGLSQAPRDDASAIGVLLADDRGAPIALQRGSSV